MPRLIIASTWCTLEVRWVPLGCAGYRWVALGTAESQPHQVWGFLKFFGLAFWDLFGRFAHHGALPKDFAKRSFWSLSLHIFGECSARNAHFGAPQASAPPLRTSGGAERPAKPTASEAPLGRLFGTTARANGRSRVAREKRAPARWQQSGASLAVGFAAFWDLFGRFGGSRSAPGVRLTRPGSQAEKAAFWGVPGALPIGLAIACVGVSAGVGVGCKSSASRM